MDHRLETFSTGQSFPFQGFIRRRRLEERMQVPVASYGSSLYCNCFRGNHPRAWRHGLPGPQLRTRLAHAGVLVLRGPQGPEIEIEQLDG